jgi:hypothetical protein
MTCSLMSVRSVVENHGESLSNFVETKLQRCYLPFLLLFAHHCFLNSESRCLASALILRRLRLLLAAGAAPGAGAAVAVPSSSAAMALAIFSRSVFNAARMVSSVKVWLLSPSSSGSISLCRSGSGMGWDIGPIASSRMRFVDSARQEPPDGQLREALNPKLAMLHADKLVEQEDYPREARSTRPHRRR